MRSVHLAQNPLSSAYDVIKSIIQRCLSVALLSLLVSPCSGFAVTLLPQEQAIATYLTTNPAQGRPNMVLDPVVEKVARARAADMGIRNYFSEVNPNGIAANYLLIQAGYQLPAWWGDAPSTNYVESIAAGSPTPSVIWQAWMNSPPHKEHLLAQNAFYATETHYGVGYYYAPNSYYKYYWVVITAPPEPIEIMSPEPLVTATTPTIPVAGLTDPTTHPATVRFRVENSNGVGDYQLASGTANWTGTATLAGGTNVIRAQSLDGSGNLIAETTGTLDYLVYAPLTVSVSGSGSVTPALAGGVTNQQVGQPITVRETPAPGSVFAGWTGSITSSSAAITFPMRAGMTLQANFIPNPFPPLAGAYDGILSTGSDTAAGLAGVTVSGQGVFSGRITMAGKSWAFTGSLNTSGSDSISIANPGGTPWTLDIQADLSGSSGQITGSLSGTGGDFDFAVSHATYTPGRNAAPEAGLYTLIIEPDPAFTGTSAPLGDGYASIAVGPAGGAYVAGRMADGTPFAASGRVADNGTLALYFLPGGAPAGSVVTGLLTFESTDVSDIDGTLAWTRGPCLRAPFYPAGFSGQLPCVGSRFVAPAAHHDAMNLLPGVMIAGFAGGGLSQSINAPVPVTLADTAYVAGPPLVHLAINPGNGLLSGIVVPAAGEAAEPVWGAVLQKQNASFGFFRGAGQYGSFSLVPGP